MEYTREEAIRDSIILWEEMVGRYERGDNVVDKIAICEHLFDEHMKNSCPLCEYTQSIGMVNPKTCVRCPYQDHFGYSCMNVQSPYNKWTNMIDMPQILLVYARNFLLQLKQIPLHDTSVKEPAKLMRFWMCYVDGSGSPHVRHWSRDIADKEAERLAKVMKSRVYVLTAVHSVVYDSPVEQSSFIGERTKHE